MISLKNVTLTFPDGDNRITALNNINLEVKDGEVMGITGPSGSGKSSLLSVVSTLITPDKGEVIIDNRNILNMTDKEKTTLRREQLGIIFQQANLIPSLTAKEQIYSVAAAEGKIDSKKDMNEKSEKLLELVGLLEHKNKRPHQLSGGQKQRINIARALYNNPTTLIVDEPTSALDQERGSEIIELILKVTKEFNTSTLLVTHDKSHLPLMNEIVTMVDGAIIS